jgi:PAS domain S-box-containing protein
MERDTLKQQIERAEERLGALQQRVGLATAQPGLAAEVLVETSTVLEDLRGIGQELRRQREALAVAREGVEAERQQMQEEQERLLAENRAQREFLERLIEAAPVGIAVVRGPDHRYELINPYYQAIPGVPDVPMVGRTIAEVFPAVTAQGALELVEAVYRTDRTTSLREYEAAVGPGRERTYWNVDHVPLHSPDGDVDGVLILASQVTDHVLARRQVEELAARDEAILTSITDGLIIFDLQGNVLDMNPAAMRIHGFERVAEAKRHLTEFPDAFALHYLDGRPMPVEEWPLARVLRGKTFTGYEARVRRLDTGETWIGSYSGTPVCDEAGTAILGVMTLRDVTAEKEVWEEHERLLAQTRQDRENVRKLAEVLERERHTLQVVMENTHAQLAYLDPEFNFVMVNSAYVQGSGYSETELIGRNHFELFPHAENQAIFERVRETGEPAAFYAKPFVYPDRPELGTTYWDWTLVPVKDRCGQIQGLVLSLLDVTERERTQKALRRYADRLQVLREMDQAILAARSGEEIAEAAVHYLPRLMPCLRASVALFDLEAGEMSVLAAHTDGETRVGKGWRGPLEADRVIEELGQGKICAVENVQTLSPSSRLIEALQAEGVDAFVNVPLIVQGEPIGSLNVGMEKPGCLTSEQAEIAREMADVLAVAIQQARLHEHIRRHADELEDEVARRTAALRASEARFRAIFEGAGIGVALIDREGRVGETNPALQDMLGYSAEELRGMPFAEVVHPDDALAHVELYRELMRDRSADDRYRMERRCVRKDSQLRWANLTISLVRNVRGRLRFAIAMVDDVTEQRQTREALIQSEKLAITGRLAASLAHEINNPLQSVIGCLDLAQESLAAGEGAGQFLQIAVEELERAAGIVTQLRDLNRSSKPEEREPSGVNALLERVLMLTKKQCQKRRVEVTWKAADDLPPLLLVPDRMQQVFLNLILNAVEAMPDGGRLEVSTSHTDEPSGVDISFTDTGRGIAPDAMPQLFDPFYTTKPEGLGLGLYVTRNIVEEHGGRIEVESQVGEGTTFTVWLPA